MKNTILIFIILATAAICRADSFQPTNFRIADPDAIVQFYLENKEDYPYDLYEVTLGALSIEINDKKDQTCFPLQRNY